MKFTDSRIKFWDPSATPQDDSEKNFMDKLKKVLTSKPYTWMIWILASLLVIVTVFVLGVQVGLHKARYSYQWGANYERNFVGPRGMMGGRNFNNRDMRNAHGLAGTIVSISDNTIIIKDRDNKENTVTVTDQTLIKDGRNNIQVGDLKTDEKIVAMGRPDNNGTIIADLIRVFENNNNQNNN